jgi:hypothetical protein
MPRINIKELGLTPEQANSIFSGLAPEEIGAKVNELQTKNVQNQEKIGTFTQKVQQINKTQDSPYKSMAVGPNAISRDEGGLKSVLYGNKLNQIKDFFTGGKQDFVADVKNLTSKETLDNLINIKAAGGTFGALSDKELQMLIDSATKIGNWEKTDEKGNTFYDIGEKYFDEELNRIRTLANKAIQGAGGSPVPASSGQTSTGIKYEIIQ